MRNVETKISCFKNRVTKIFQFKDRQLTLKKLITTIKIMLKKAFHTATKIIMLHKIDIVGGIFIAIYFKLMTNKTLTANQNPFELKGQAHLKCKKRARSESWLLVF